MVYPIAVGAYLSHLVPGLQIDQLMQNKLGLPFFVTPKARILGILGYPVSRSLSPWMQACLMKLANEDGVYVPFEVQPQKFLAAVRGIRALGIDGLNVTVPFKEAFLPHIDILTKEAKAIGALNTVVTLENDRLLGHNTDAAGFLDGLSFGFKIDNLLGKEVLVIGAGGASRAVVYALSKLSPDCIFIVNRTQAKANILKSKAQVLFPNLSYEVAPFDSIEQQIFMKRFSLIAQTTSTELQDRGMLSISFPRRLVYPAIAIDLIYKPLITPFLKKALSIGACVQNGLPMLLFQGLRSFELFFGKSLRINTTKFLEAMENRAKKPL